MQLRVFDAGIVTVQTQSLKRHYEYLAGKNLKYQIMAVRISRDSIEINVMYKLYKLCIRNV